MGRSIWDEMRRMQEEMERLFSNFFAYEPSNLLTTDRFLPAGSSIGTEVSNYRKALADVWETDKEIVANIELPGVDKDDIQINATEDGIEVKVEKKDEREEKKKGMYRLERSYAGFYRYIPMPDGADVDNINANYKNGVLEIRIPKAETKKKGKRIKVN